MKQVYEISLLYDFYGELLTQGQREILQMYYFEDLSLAEISQARGASRSAAYDLIKRSEQKLRDYEEKLHLIERFRGQSDRYDRVLALVEEARRSAEQPETVRLLLGEALEEARRLESFSAI